MDPNLLNKIQAIKTLRDRAGTEGEKDAAQHKLTLIMAKHKLTEQDIPDPHFSTHQRLYNTHPFTSRSRPNPSQNRRQRYDDYNRPPRKRRGQKNRERFEKVFGSPISHIAWRTLEYDYLRAKRVAAPSNPNAFARAYMEWTAIQLIERLHGPTYLRRATKSKNPEGMEAAEHFVERIDPKLFS